MLPERDCESETQPGSAEPAPPGHGTILGPNGAPKSRIDADGRRTDAAGRGAGRMTADGHVYDASGALAGRVDDNGTVFDRAGAVDLSRCPAPTGSGTAHGATDTGGAEFKLCECAGDPAFPGS